MPIPLDLSGNTAWKLCLMRRVSARAELSLRQRLSQREDRISELKDALATAKSQQLGTHTAQSQSPPPQNCYANDIHHSKRSQLKAPWPQGQLQRRPRQHPDQFQQHAPSPDDSDYQEEEEGLQQSSLRAATRAHQGQHQHGAPSPRDRESHNEAEEQGQPRAVQNPVARLPYFQPGSHKRTALAQGGPHPNAPLPETWPQPVAPPASISCVALGRSDSVYDQLSTVPPSSMAADSGSCIKI